MNIQLRKIDSDTYIWDDQVFKDLKHAAFDVDYKKASAAEKAIALQQVKDFEVWFIQYADDIFKGAKYDYEAVVGNTYALMHKELTQGQAKSFFRYSLYVAREYMVNLQQCRVMDVSTIDRYETELRNMCCDLEWLIINYEVVCKNTCQKMRPTTGAYKGFSPHDMQMTINHFYYMEDVPSIRDLTCSKMKNVLIFQIRMLLETMGRNIIGYVDIVDAKGQVSKKFTQVAWEFLSSNNNHNGWNVTLPNGLPIKTVHTVSKWANSFVHTSYYYTDYFQFYAMCVADELFRYPSIASGKVPCRWNINFGDIHITGYEALKADFENYVNKRGRRSSSFFLCMKDWLLRLIKKQKKTVVSVNWKELKDVGAWIDSI